MTYIYFTIIVLFSMSVALIEAKGMKKGVRLSYASKLNVFALFCVVFAYVLSSSISVSWWIFCGITSVLIKVGVYDTFLNKFSGRPFFYDSNKIKNGYERLLFKLHIHPIDIQVLSFILSIVWLVGHEYIIIF